jgi:DNA-directed RNA polymerase specialized sigma24 family protein
VVIARALAAIRDKLAASARRTEDHCPNDRSSPCRDWALDRTTSKTQIEHALLAIDVFPRAALLLSIFEGVPIEETAALLGASAKLVAKALAIGLRELTSNLAKLQGWTSGAASRSVLHNETQYA